MIKPVFIVAEDPHKLETEADVLALLDSVEDYLLKKHPQIDDGMWRFMINRSPDHGQDQLAIETIDRLRMVRDALQNPTTPAWRVAAVAMSYQDRVMSYWQPVSRTAAGRVYADRKKPRQAKDELTMRVMRNLRGQHKSWKEALRDLEEACRHGDSIAGVAIENSGEYWIFTRQRKNNKSDQVEKFKVSTLQEKKFRKAK